MALHAAAQASLSSMRGSAALPKPSIAYRLVQLAAGDAVVGVSLVPIAAHEVVGGHALVIGAQGVHLDSDGARMS